MFFVPIFFIFSYLFLIGLDYTSLPFDCKQHLFIRILDFMYRTILGVQIRMKKTVVSNSQRKTIVLSNYENITDIFTILWVHLSLFPQHEPIFILPKHFEAVPIFGKYLEQNHILLDSEMTGFHIKSSQMFLQNFNKPFVLYIFPEWDFVMGNHEPKENKFKHIHAPNTNIFSLFQTYVDNIIDLTLVNQGSDSRNLISLFQGKYPFFSEIFAQDVTDQMKELISETMFQIWEQKEMLFEKQRQNEYWFDFDQMIEKCCKGGVAIHFILLGLALMWSFDLIYFLLGFMFVMTCHENYVQKRHFWLNKFCLLLFGLLYPGFFMFGHAFLNIGFSQYKPYVSDG